MYLISRVKLVSIAMCFVLAAPALAQKTTYICNVDDKNAGVIQPELALGYDDAANSVVVFDGLIQHFVGKPVKGKISEKSDKKQVFNWTVTQTNNRGQQTVMRYRASIFLKTGKAIVSAKPHGYNNNFISRGRCKIDNRFRFPGS